MYSLQYEQFIPATISQTWAFFSTPMNLARITPPEMDFRVLTLLDKKEIYKDMIIDYTVRPLWNIKFHWRTSITKSERPYMFEDIQLKGPYRKWIHTHYFEERPGGVMMKDHIQYSLYGGIIGRGLHAWIIRKKLEKIFAYRRAAIKKIFTQDAHH